MVNKNVNNEINRSARRPIVSSLKIDRKDENVKQQQQQTMKRTVANDDIKSQQQQQQRPTTASRPLTARAAPPRAVSRRALREEQTSNVLEMASLSRPQTAVKQVLVTNLIIKESNDDSLDEDESSSLNDEKLDKRALTANKEHLALKDSIRKLDEQQNDFLLNKNQLNKNEAENEPEKGSLVKKLIKSKMELEFTANENQQTQISSATLIRSNRDIERLKEHIQTLTKLANPLSKLLDNLQEDIDLMLLEERNWLEEQQRNEQQLLTLREQMNEELNNLNLQITNLDDQIQQEKDAILVTNVNLLTNQTKLENIVRRMIEN